MQPLPEDLDAAVEFLRQNGYRRPAELLAMFRTFQTMAERLQLQPSDDVRGAQMNLGAMFEALAGSEPMPPQLDAGICQVFQNVSGLDLSSEVAARLKVALLQLFRKTKAEGYDGVFVTREVILHQMSDRELGELVRTNAAHLRVPLTLKEAAAQVQAQLVASGIEEGIGLPQVLRGPTVEDLLDGQSRAGEKQEEDET